MEMLDPYGEKEGSLNSDVPSLGSQCDEFGSELQEFHEEPRLLFGSSTDDSEKDHLPDGYSIDPSFTRLTRRDSNGFLGCRTIHDKKGGGLTHDSWFCFKIKQVERIEQTKDSGYDIKYYWQQPSVFVSWNTKDHVTLVLCIDAPEQLQRHIMNAWKQGLVDQTDPYGWHCLIIDGISELYNHSVWNLRDLVREDVEKRRSPESTNFERLHDIARHIIHSNETLEVALSTLDGIQQAHQLFSEEVSSVQEKPLQFSFRHTQLEISHLRRTIKAIYTRSKSFIDRIQNEINLAYNLANQRDSFLMKTIAIMSLIYLPGTYLASIFGMNFFDFSMSNGLETSDMFWLYWVLTAVMTLVTVGAWVIWQGRSRHSQKPDVARESQRSSPTKVSAWLGGSALTLGWAKLKNRTASNAKPTSPV